MCSLFRKKRSGFRSLWDQPSSQSTWGVVGAQGTKVLSLELQGLGCSSTGLCLTLSIGSGYFVMADVSPPETPWSWNFVFTVWIFALCFSQNNALRGAGRTKEQNFCSTAPGEAVKTFLDWMNSSFKINLACCSLPCSPVLAKQSVVGQQWFNPVCPGVQEAPAEVVLCGCF